MVPVGPVFVAEAVVEARETTMEPAAMKPAGVKSAPMKSAAMKYGKSTTALETPASAPAVRRCVGEI